MILITDFCNQNCGFCFAREEMKSPLKKEMSMIDFRLLVKKLKKNNIMGIHLVGGEPTIHSEFPKILEYSLKNFIFVSVLTNGVFTKPVEELLLKKQPRVPIQFNIATPGFIFNQKVRELVLEKISKFAEVASTTLTITSNFMDISLVKQIFSYFDRALLRKVVIRLGVEKPVVGGNNSVVMGDFPHIGRNFCEAIAYLDEIGPPRGIVTNRGMITPCMFTKEETKYLTQKGIWGQGYLNEFECHPPHEPYWFAINASLETFKSYSLSMINRFQIQKDTDIATLKSKYDYLHEKYQKELVLPECKKCPFYGIESGKCSGPCFAFRMNALRSQTNKSTHNHLTA